MWNQFGEEFREEEGNSPHLFCTHVAISRPGIGDTGDRKEKQDVCCNLERGSLVVESIEIGRVDLNGIDKQIQDSLFDLLLGQVYRQAEVGMRLDFILNRTLVCSLEEEVRRQCTAGVQLGFFTISFSYY